jgi:hypothetical protein
MTLAQAQTAAGVIFDGVGDGAYYPTTLPAGYPHLFVNGATVRCVGAQIGPLAVTSQTVTTPEGMQLGDSVGKLRAIYGNRATYYPSPSGGMTAHAGYVVSEAGGDLVFQVDGAGGRVIGITGGPSGLTPNNCSG